MFGKGCEIPKLKLKINVLPDNGKQGIMTGDDK